MITLAAVHAYIAIHLISWHVFGIQIWGKTAMMGVPSLAKGWINAASIMVILILLSIFILYFRKRFLWVGMLYARSH